MKRNPFKVLVRKPEGKSQPGRCRHRWEDNIKILKDLKIVGWETMD
jgi:hypothetical protein